MSKDPVIKNIDKLTGNTPLYYIKSLSEETGNNIYAKLEWYNPTGSVKDRIVSYILQKTEAVGHITPGCTIIEPTSGNTGVSLAAYGTAKGYKVILIMPDTAPVERRQVLSALGAELIITPAEQGMRGSIEKAEELSASIKNSFMLHQFITPANPEAHYETTGPEIWKQTGSKIDILITGIGTGGTITGTGKYLKRKNPYIKIIGVEPAESPVLSGGEAGRHTITGIGAGFIPKTLDIKILDNIITIKSTEAKEAVKLTAKKEGLLIGPSSGANIKAIEKYCKDNNIRGKNIITIFPDSGISYLSTGLYR
ncbi:cysteine synthase A [Spirochaetia bacterium 38H-sp]|uniref:cysteine synthase n=1 Tax=Rarispira pelagica TaxID=3141764 RepID=A0ABU9UB75_9SPIR